MIVTPDTTISTIAAVEDTDGADDDPGPSCATVLIAHDAWCGVGDVTRTVDAAYRATLALVPHIAGREVAVALTDDDEITRLNAQYRGLNKPTNILSFPSAGLPPSGMGDEPPLGDIVMAYETVMKEAAGDAKPPLAHLAHLTVHGLLHLAGLDHETDADAERMEALEREILAALGIPDPYQTFSDEAPALAG